jgi:hypothetical protein
MRSTSERSCVARRALPKRWAARSRPGNGAYRGRRALRPRNAAMVGPARRSLPQVDITRAVLFTLLIAFLTMTVLPILLELAGAPFR